MKWKEIEFIGLCVLSLLLSAYLTDVLAWSNGGYSADPSNPDYGTHDWIAQHALDWLPLSEKQYIVNNLAIYLYGTELPDNSQAADGIGDTINHHFYYSSAEAVTDDIAAVRALTVYNQALSFLKSGDSANAAKHAGTMSHYIVDLAVFGHVMGSGTDWGAETHHSDYESYVNQRTSSYSAEFNVYLSFDGNLKVISAYDAAKELAYDTTFDVNGDLTCLWMDQNYNWNNPTFRNRCGESLNLAVNYLADVLHTLYAQEEKRAWVSGTYLAVVEVGDSWSSGPHGDQYTTSTSFTATEEQVTVSVDSGESLLLLGSAQFWNDRSNVGSSIAIFRDGSRISGDMFAVGATMGHRHAGTAIAVDIPETGSFTYTLRFKTDPGGAAWVSATYLLAVKILSSQSSGPHGDQSTTSTSFAPTVESLTVSGSGGTTLLLVASSQIWNGRSDVGSSISIYRDDSIISGDMFALGATMSHRNIAVAIAIDTVPDNEAHTYSLRFKTDPGGKAWVSATYLALIPISIAYSSGPTGDQSTTHLSFTNTQETIAVSSTLNKYLLIGSSQIWNALGDIGSSICILKDGLRISGDMFTLGAHMGHRHMATAIAIDQPGTGTFTYALGFKTD